jgi:hypothetical protein
MIIAVISSATYLPVVFAMGLAPRRCTADE